jgi:hypothetical protein
MTPDLSSIEQLAAATAAIQSGYNAPCSAVKVTWDPMQNRDIGAARRGALSGIAPAAGMVQ